MFRWFPRADARGPIEAYLDGDVLEPKPRFHARTRVAQLKPPNLQRSLSPYNAFPRADARGPIEALTIFRAFSLPSQFPRADARGPIEAASPVVRQVWVAASCF